MLFCKELKLNSLYIIMIIMTIIIIIIVFFHQWTFSWWKKQLHILLNIHLLLYNGKKDKKETNIKLLNILIITCLLFKRKKYLSMMKEHSCIM